MERTDFFGVSGAVKFDKLGNRMSKVVVEQLRRESHRVRAIDRTLPVSDGVYRRLARYDAEKRSIEWLGGEEPDGSRCWNYNSSNSSSKTPMSI